MPFIQCDRSTTFQNCVRRTNSFLVITPHSARILRPTQPPLANLPTSSSRAPVLMRFKLTIRNVFLVASALCAIWVIGMLLWLHFANQISTPHTVLQYYGLAVCSVAALAGAIHNSPGLIRRIYALLMLLAIGLSLAVTMLPSQPDASSVGRAENLIQQLPFAEHLARLLAVNQHAAVADNPTNAPGNSPVEIIGYFALAIFAVWQVCRKTPERRRFG